MAVEGINRSYGIPAVNNKTEPPLNKKKKDQRRERKNKNREEEPAETNRGRVDIRI